MPGGIALDSKPVLAAAARCQNSCDGSPQGPQGWLQLPLPDGECVGANGLLGYITAVKLVCLYCLLACLLIVDTAQSVLLCFTFSQTH